MNTANEVFIFLIGITIVVSILIYAFKKHPPVAVDYSITEKCNHPVKITRVIESYANCEITIEVCADCFKELTEPKTDCR